MNKDKIGNVKRLYWIPKSLKRFVDDFSIEKDISNSMVVQLALEMLENDINKSNMSFNSYILESPAKLGFKRDRKDKMVPFTVWLPLGVLKKIESYPVKHSSIIRRAINLLKEKGEKTSEISKDYEL